MKKDEVFVGMIVALNDLPDGQLYKVKAKDGFLVKLTYATNERVIGGQSDTSLLLKPTYEQLYNSLCRIN